MGALAAGEDAHGPRGPAVELVPGRAVAQQPGQLGDAGSFPPSGGVQIAAPPAWALWPFRMAQGYRRRYPDWPGYGVQGVRAGDEVVGQAISTQVSAPS